MLIWILVIWYCIGCCLPIHVYLYLSLDHHTMNWFHLFSALLIAFLFQVYFVVFDYYYCCCYLTFPFGILLTVYYSTLCQINECSCVCMYYCFTQIPRPTHKNHTLLILIFRNYYFAYVLYITSWKCLFQA